MVNQIIPGTKIQCKRTTVLQDVKGLFCMVKVDEIITAVELKPARPKETGLKSANNKYVLTCPSGTLLKTFKVV